MSRKQKGIHKKLKQASLNDFDLSNSKEEANIALDAYGEFLMKNTNIHSVSVIEKNHNYILECSVYSLDEEKNSIVKNQFEKFAFHENQDLIEYQLPNSDSLEENQIKSIEDIDNLQRESKKYITIELKEAKFKKLRKSKLKKRVLKNYPLDRPFLGGSNISYADSNTYGTLGAVVKLEGYEDLFLMTAAHVICSDSLLADPENDSSLVNVVQPSYRASRYVVSEEYDRRVATVFWWKKNQYFDIAFAKVSNKENAKSGVKHHGKIEGLGTPKYGLRVKMYGAYSKDENLRGTITTEKSFVRNSQGSDDFTKNLFRTSDMGNEGDSGAILLSDDPFSRNQAVGIAILDAEENYTTFMRLDVLEKEISGHGVVPKIKFESFY